MHVCVASTHAGSLAATPIGIRGTSSMGGSRYVGSHSLPASKSKPASSLGRRRSSLVARNLDVGTYSHDSRVLEHLVTLLPPFFLFLKTTTVVLIYKCSFNDHIPNYQPYIYPNCITNFIFLQILPLFLNK
jgi:hypothetical protein